MPTPLYWHLFRLLLLLSLQGCAGQSESARGPALDGAVWLSCGVPLPSDCAARSRKYAALPSTYPCSSCSVDAQGELGSNKARELVSRAQKAELVPLLERAAKGEFGDTVKQRQRWELELARALHSAGDWGAADDLYVLITRDRGHAKCLEADLYLLAGVQACPTLRTLAWMESFNPEPRWRPENTYLKSPFLFMYKARGLAERGKYDEARVLFKEFGPQVTDPPAFVAQCIEWLEGRPNQRTAAPVGRPCNCDIEPPQWREGCGCEPRQPFVAPEAPEPEPEPEPVPPPGECLCDPSGLRCERRVPLVDLDDAKASSWTSERCRAAHDAADILASGEAKKLLQKRWR